MHHCGPDEAVAAVLGSRDVRCVFGLGLWCSDSVRRAEDGVRRGCWVCLGRKPARGQSWPFGTVTWAGLTSSTEICGAGGPRSLLAWEVSACVPLQSWSGD